MLGLCAAGGIARSETLRTQEIELQTGWNAVYLEVQPVEDRPGEVFRQLPVATVACLIPGAPSGQFLRRPGDAPWRSEHWAVWHAAGRPESFLSNLHRVIGRRAYLVEATEPVTWRVRGEVRAAALAWEPNAYTLTGLPVASGSALTFGEFFAGSAAHASLRVFRLVDGEWQSARDAALQQVRAGEAYWIETTGASGHQGPIALKLPALGEIDFDLRGAVAEVRIENRSERPSTVRVEVHGEAGGLGLTWSRPWPGAADGMQPLPAALELPPLAAGAVHALRLAPDRARMQAASASTLLRFSDGRGWERWVPVRARRESPWVAQQP